jgi:hypothetical protein
MYTVLDVLHGVWMKYRQSSLQPWEWCWERETTVSADGKPANLCREIAGQAASGVTGFRLDVVNRGERIAVGGSAALNWLEVTRFFTPRAADVSGHGPNAKSMGR